ncbi:MAG TPA: iron ABC transporter substrate-binding protein, partial [Actinomycetota bacterium]|nr:iron ABC transporter substrate-binding protein [Actinomycetota bacterium]
LLARFEEQNGIALEVRYGDSAELAATILEEGQNSPADVFISQDAGSLGSVADEGLFTEIDQGILDRVDERFRSAEGLWVGVSGRARVAAYNTERLQEDDLPASIMDFTDPEWRGRIGFPPTNASFQAFVAAMLITEGEETTREWLEGIVANEPRQYEGNSEVVQGIADGEIDVGFVNHYYKYELEAEEGSELPVANHFFSGGDPGALVNVAGAATLATTDRPEEASRLIDFLTGPEGQEYFATETWEYPVIDGVDPQAELPSLEEIESPELDLSDLGGTLEPALRLLADVGLV